MKKITLPSLVILLALSCTDQVHDIRYTDYTPPVSSSLQNQLVSPCLFNTASRVLTPGLPSVYSALIQDVSNSKVEVNLILKEGSVSDPYGKTGTAKLNAHSGMIDVTVILNPSKFVGSSEEFLGALIYHECFHALLNYLTNNDTPTDDKHIQMFNYHLDLLASGLQTAYPNMQLEDAKGLLLKSIVSLDGGTWPDTKHWSSSFVDQILVGSGFSNAQINQIYARYQTDHTSGTPCK